MLLSNLSTANLILCSWQLVLGHRMFPLSWIYLVDMSRSQLLCFRAAKRGLRLAVMSQSRLKTLGVRRKSPGQRAERRRTVFLLTTCFETRAWLGVAVPNCTVDNVLEMPQSQPRIAVSHRQGFYAWLLAGFPFILVPTGSARTAGMTAGPPEFGA
jgi:hypothetical protein